jgi:hypothetical protein
MNDTMAAEMARLLARFVVNILVYFPERSSLFFICCFCLYLPWSGQKHVNTCFVA